MKTRTKALLISLCAVLLVVTTVAATVAFLTSNDTVTNTFTVGKVAITLDEAQVNPDGSAVAGADRVKANEYHLIPAHTYIKDPTIHVDGASEDCWLFVKVVNGIAAIEDTQNTVASQMAANGWTPVAGQTDVYAYNRKVSAGSDIPVFASFKIAGDADIAPYAQASVTVTAYAVQADGFDTAAAAIASAPFPAN